MDVDVVMSSRAGATSCASLCSAAPCCGVLVLVLVLMLMLM